MNSQPDRTMGRNPAVNASGRATDARKASGTGASSSPHKALSDIQPVNASLCGVCLRPLPPGAGAKFCSSRHRLMAWWLKETAKALHDGMVDGLRAEIRRLGEAA